MIANSERLKTADEHGPVAGISIMDQIARCPVPATRLRDLVGNPLGGGMRGHLPLQHSQLMPERSILRLKSAHRLERQRQDAWRAGCFRRLIVATTPRSQ